MYDVEVYENNIRKVLFGSAVTTVSLDEGI